MFCPIASDELCLLELPLYEKGNKSEGDNFRPVSILSMVSKMLERAIKSIFD